MQIFSLEQSPEWMRVQCSVAGRRPGPGVAGVRTIEQSAGLGMKWWWIPGVLGWSEAMEQELRACARGSDVMFARVEPWILGEAGVSESYLPRHSLILDLSLSEADLLAQMEQKGRYNIRQAEKAGVEVDEAGAADVGDFYKLLADTGGRDGFGVHPLHFYEAVMREMGSAAHLYLARVEGEVVAGIIVIDWEGVAIYYYGASSSADRKSYASYLLQWTAILEAKARGLKAYDFFGVAPEGDSRHAWAGVTQFKTRFGGKRVEYEAAKVVVFRPWRYWTYRALKYAARIWRAFS